MTPLMIFDFCMRASVRERSRKKLYEKSLSPTFHVYIYFLRPQLKVLADINIACQRRDGLICYSYSKISTLVMLFWFVIELLH